MRRSGKQRLVAALLGVAAVVCFAHWVPRAARSGLEATLVRQRTRGKTRFAFSMLAARGIPGELSESRFGPRDRLRATRIARLPGRIAWVQVQAPEAPGFAAGPFVGQRPPAAPPNAVLNGDATVRAGERTHLVW